jgi:hypothetical protein
MNAATGFAEVPGFYRVGVCELAASKLFATADAASWRWSTFSKTHWQAYEVSGCWMNDAFDTQRRRGQDPQVKTVRNF